MRQSIMIDMDDVITECDFLKVYEEFTGEKLDLEKNKTFFLQTLLSDEDRKKFFENWDKVNLYERAVPYDNCVESIEFLSHMYDIYICTDYIWIDAAWAAGINAKNKYDFLIKHFPFIDPRHFVFTGAKSIIATDIKIDDRVCNLENCNKKILYTAWHNKDISNEELKKNNIIRVNNWDDILNELL